MMLGHLPRVHETVAPADTNCPCCNKPKHMIGEETSERLDVIPARYRVIVMHRPKLAIDKDKGQQTGSVKREKTMAVNFSRLNLL